MAIFLGRAQGLFILNVAAAFGHSVIRHSLFALNLRRLNFEPSNVKQNKTRRTKPEMTAEKKKKLRQRQRQSGRQLKSRKWAGARSPNGTEQTRLSTCHTLQAAQDSNNNNYNKKEELLRSQAAAACLSLGICFTLSA